MSDAVTIVITGVLDHRRIANIIQQVDPARRVVIDVAQTTGTDSTNIAVCLQAAAITGKPVTVRGCSQRFAIALTQMRIGHLVQVQAK
jgi:anti-anti-sigma regulatory factor